MKLCDYLLNDSQELAIDWTEGPLLVLAGPGSGKTLVLTLRIVRLLETDREASVLALTFTTAAAAAMRQRLDGLVGRYEGRAHLCTFHSFAADLLRQHGSHVGIQPDFAVLANQEDRLATLEQAISEVDNYQTVVPSDRRNLLVLLDRLFSDSYNGEPEARGLTTTPQWLPELFTEFCRVQQKSNRLDYGGLLHFARRLLEESVAVTRLTKLAWRHVCVDEFQDTNKAQYDLLRLLVSGQQPNLFVVADDDQTIYQWNGASPQRIATLISEFNMSTIQLPTSYRCPPEIIQLANRLIAHNRNRYPGKTPLVPHRSQPDATVVTLRTFDQESEEAAMVATTIRRNRWKPSECVVLARTNRLISGVADKLREYGVTPYIAQRKTEFESASVRWLYASLRLGNARHDHDFLRQLCMAWYAFTDTVIEVDSVEAAAAVQGGDFLRAWVEQALSIEGVQELEPLLRHLLDDLVERLEFTGLLEWFWRQSWLGDETEIEEIETWQALHREILREQPGAEMTLHSYVQELDLRSKAPLRPPESVECLTVHRAKGLEFKHVFLTGMAHEIFPAYQAVRKGAQSREMEEERRSCFVAITRAQETLHLSWAKRYMGYARRPSRFLSEMGFDL